MGDSHRSGGKKLIWAGAAWAEGRLAAGRSALAEDCAFFGIDPALFTDDEAEEGVWPENAPAVDAFLAVSTQWRMVASAGGPLVYGGLDYTGVRAGLDLAGITPSPALWADVQLIEAGALGALNRRQ